MRPFVGMPCLIHLPGVAGVDEAGRGPLAGPVVVAAVVLPAGFELTGLNDSKKMSEAQRNEQAKRLRESADYCVVHVSPEEIDRLNILKATMKGMSRALKGLKSPVTTALIDGDHYPIDPPCSCQPVIRGDGTYAAIAAASILAKTERDELMRAMSVIYPQYGFDHNFGYPTPEHIEMIKLHGPCPAHRRSFGIVRELLEQPCLALAE